MNITKHAFQRMQERNFTPEMLGRLLNGKIIVLPSRDDTSIVIGRADGNIWAVIVASEDTVVSVRRAHRDEVAIWNSKS